MPLSEECSQVSDVPFLCIEDGDERLASYDFLDPLGLVSLAPV